MGMTDRQFDVFLENQLRELLLAQKELNEIGAKSPILDEMIEALKRQLKRP